MKTFIHWSGGKDAAMALHIFTQEYNAVPGLLLCRCTPEGIVATHEIHVDLVRAQAQALQIPLQTIQVPAFSPNTVYEEIMGFQLQRLAAQGYTHAVLGDIFLEELKNYHVSLHARYGIQCVFPLWGQNTQNLAPAIVHSGIQAIVTAVNTKLLNEGLAGCLFDTDFINALPANADACGENGEFHSLVFNAPLFSHPLKLKVGEEITKITYHAGTQYEAQMACCKITLDE